MKRVWLGISMLALSLMGSPWPGTQTLGWADDACPAMDMEYGEHSGCPYFDEMRAYGECDWYHDNYRHGALSDEATGEAAQAITAASEATVKATVEAAIEMTLEATVDTGVQADVDATAAADSAASSDAAGAADCWYDCETDEYYHYEFSQLPSETVTDASTEHASAWDEGDCLDEFYADEDDVDEAYADCVDESSIAEVCREPVAAASPACEEAAIEDIATEDAWRGDYDYGDSMDAGAWEQDFIEDDPEVAEGATDETEIAQPSGEYQYEDGGCPYDYEYYQNNGFSDSMPVQTRHDADVEAIEGGDDDDDAVPPAPASDLAQFDSEVILSLARTLDRVGSTLQSLSHYLTEMATANMAERHAPAIHR